MSKTGGERGTNQHQVKGRSVAGGRVSRSRYRPREEAITPVAESPAHHQAYPLDRVRLLEPTDADLGRFRPRGTQRALARYAERRADFAFASAYLEGNTFTLPEVYTLLDGTTPDGKDASDADQLLDLSEASEALATRIEDDAFALDLEISDDLNRIIARHEALDAGIRRTRSQTNPDGRSATVNIQGDAFEGMDKLTLAAAEPVLLERSAAIDHPVLRAANYAAMASYSQMYLDGNKRTARYMMDGEMMRSGFDAVAIPAARRREYQDALSDMFRTTDCSPYALFLLDVAHRGDPVA